VVCDCPGSQPPQCLLVTLIAITTHLYPLSPRYFAGACRTLFAAGIGVSAAAYRSGIFSLQPIKLPEVLEWSFSMVL